jgi:tetratricopeptide (TPR) repeat protein
MSTRSRQRWTLVACAAAIGVAFAAAGAPAQRRNVICNLVSKPSDDLIRSCTERINHGGDLGRPLAEVYVARGRAYMAKSQYEQGLADFNEAVKAAPDYVLALRSRGNAHLRRAEYERAIKDYTEAIWLAPRDAGLFHERAQAYEGKGDYRLAILDYDEVMRLAPRFVAAYRDRCNMRMMFGRELPQALGDCNDALRLLPNDPLTLERRGFVYLRLNLFDKAISDFDAVLKYNPLHAPALYGRGVAKHKKYDSTADADINTAQQLRPDVVELYASHGIK